MRTSEELYNIRIGTALTQTHILAPTTMITTTNLGRTRTKLNNNAQLRADFNLSIKPGKCDNLSRVKRFGHSAFSQVKKLYQTIKVQIKAKGTIEKLVLKEVYKETDVWHVHHMCVSRISLIIRFAFCRACNNNRNIMKNLGSTQQILSTQNVVKHYKLLTKVNPSPNYLNLV